MGFLQAVGSCVVLFGAYFVISEGIVVDEATSNASALNPLMYRGLFLFAAVPASISTYMKYDLFSKMVSTEKATTSNTQVFPFSLKECASCPVVYLSMT